MVTAAIVVAADQASKSLALATLADGPVDLIPGAFTFRLTYNSGGAFGVLQGFPTFFLFATLAIMASVVLLVRRLEDSRLVWPLGLVLGGGLGNVVDRLLRDHGGAVVDFIDLHVWPVFNVADASIVSGVALILLFSGPGAKPSTESERRASPPPGS